jgi:hypothetical protein
MMGGMKTTIRTGDVDMEYDGDVNSSVEPHGTGTATWGKDKERKYTGQWEDGFMHGKGMFTWHSKRGDTVYEGDYVNGKREGRGKFTTNLGEVYEGEWKDDKKNGSGTITTKDGVTFTVQSTDGVMVPSEMSRRRSRSRSRSRSRGSGAAGGQ